MALEQVSIAAVTAVVGFNLLQSSTFRQVGVPRTIKGAALAGSAAALDTQIEIVVGTNVVARMFNTGTGSFNRDDLLPIGAMVPANTEISARVVDAPATNPINLAIDFSN